MTAPAQTPVINPARVQQPQQPQKDAVPPKRMMRFQVIEGTAYTGSKRTNNLKKWVGGDVLESDINLAKRFKNKFIRVADNAPLTDPADNDAPHLHSVEEQMEWEERETTQNEYQTMTLKQLKALCREEGLDITGVTRKEEMISLLQTSDALNG